MSCNLVNFILVNQESEVGWGWQRGEDTRKKEKKKERKGKRKSKRKGERKGERVKERAKG